MDGNSYATDISDGSNLCHPLPQLLDPKSDNLTSSIGGCQVIMACATWSEGLERNVQKHIPSVQRITSKELQQMRFQVEQVFVKVQTHLKAGMCVNS